MPFGGRKDPVTRTVYQVIRDEYRPSGQERDVTCFTGLDLQKDTTQRDSTSRSRGISAEDGIRLTRAGDGPSLAAWNLGSPSFLAV